MEKYDDMPPLEEAEPSEPSRGAGGKVRRQFNRRSRTTPYSRPKPDLSQAPNADGGGGGGGWLSMLVTPARRLISSGAARILPALWSPAVDSPALSSDENHDTEQNEVDDSGEDEIRRDNSVATFPLSHQISDAKIVEYGSSSTAAPDEVKDDEARDTTDNNSLSEIEKLIRDKSFSRNEVERLMEILNSKNKENSKNKDSAKLDGPKVQPIMAGEEVPMSAMALMFPNKAKPEGQERVNRQSQEIQTPLPKPNLRSDIGASPIDIARAYMGSRALDVVSSSISKTFEDDKALVHTGPSNSNVPSPSRKSSTCWPGAMVPEQFSTPHTQRGRYDFHNFRRTPYSRSVKPVSKFKLNQHRDEATNSLNFTSTPLPQPSTTISGQVKNSSIRALDSHYASGGPFRHARHQFAPASPRKSVSFSPLPSPLHREKADMAIPPFRRNADSIGTSILKPKTVEDKPQSIGFKASNVHTHSTQMAKKILEHLDRTVPTPKDMSAEFRLLNSGGKPASSEVISLGDGPDSQAAAEKTDHSTKHLNIERTPLSFQAPPTENTVKGKSSAPESGDFCTVPAGDTEANNTFKNLPKFTPSSLNAQSQHPWRKPPTPIPAQKTVLPSISITKAPINPTITPDNNISGFTFQVPASPPSFPEPPTPSLMIPPSLLNGDSDIPTFSFGPKSSSTSPLVFSFPSASVLDDALSDIKYLFGGSDKARIDFGSVKKDAVSC